MTHTSASAWPISASSNLSDPTFDHLPAGVSPAMAAHLAAHGAQHAHDDVNHVLMRLVEVHRDSLLLHDGTHHHPARALPRVLRELADAGSGLAVGDWAHVQRDAHGALWLHGIVPPRTRIVRRDADGTRHPVVSNVDLALLVMGMDDDFNLRRLERYLALVHGSGVTPLIVLTKADVPSFRDAAERIAELRARWPSGIDALAVNGRHASAAEALAPWLTRGRTVVLMGSSGAGKSTLANTLIGRELQDTGAVREHDSRGKHTTTTRTLHALPGGACVIDTPGLRALRPDVDAAQLAGLFGDIGEAARHCRFRDCRHGDEPGCAVHEAIDPDRVLNFQKLQREARRDSLSALERQQQLAQWKARGRAGRQRLKMKRGAT